MSLYCSACNSLVDDASKESCPACGRERPPGLGFPDDARIGSLVAGEQYRVVRRIGAGGFGIVYEVETVVGHLRRALKVLGRRWAEDAVICERFVNEALVLEQINHPNVARCFAAGRLKEGELYLLLELIDGVSLTSLLGVEDGNGKPIAPMRAVRIAKQVAAGLKAAHEADVLHRDLKPDNILITNVGTLNERAKVIDFGIAKITHDGTADTQTIVGTPAFMAPEQFFPGSPLDARVDIWQLGAILYSMLTGLAPYGDTKGGVAAIIAKQQARAEEQGPKPSDVVPELAEVPGLDDLVSRMLATDATKRPGSAAEVCELLARIEHGLVTDGGQLGSEALLSALTATASDSAWVALHGYLASATSDIDSLTAAADRLLDNWPDSLRRAPNGLWQRALRGANVPGWHLVRSLDLSARGLTDLEVAKLAESPALKNVTRLNLSGNQIGNDGVAALAQSPHLSNLVHLDLSFNQISSKGLVTLAEATAEGLRSLQVARNGIGGRGVAALAESRLRLHKLDLSGNEIGAEGCRHLAESASLAGLVDLRLANTGIGADGVAALAATGTLSRLIMLDLGYNAIGPSGAAALALCQSMSSLRSLLLAQNALGRQGLSLLFGTNPFRHLTELDLSGNALGPSGAMVLASAPFVRQLDTLRVADNDLGGAGAAVIIGSAHLAGLRRLDLSRNALGEAGVHLLIDSPPQLRELTLTGNPIGDDGAKAVADAVARLRLDHLDVGACDLSGASLGEILREGRLLSLNASRNKIDCAGAAAFADDSGARSLEVLDLSHAGLGANGVAELLGSNDLSGLRSLDLSANELGGSATELVGAGPRLPRLEVLRLEDNDLGPAAAEALAASTFATHLSALHLAYNHLGDAGAEILSRGHWHSLRKLDVKGNELSLGGAAAILTSPRLQVLQCVNLSHNALSAVPDVYAIGKSDIELIEETFDLVREAGADFAESFYDQLFGRFPQVKPLFASTSMAKQYKHLMSTLSLVIDNLRKPEALEEAIVGLGTRHVGYGVSPSHYYAVTSTLLERLADLYGASWSDELAGAWSGALDAISMTMMSAPRPAAASSRAAGDTTAQGHRLHGDAPSS